jgi:hypothetical protein
MPNPLYALLPPVLLLCSIPLGIFAIFTSTVAFGTLFFRALLVYIELAVVITHSYLFIIPAPSLSRTQRPGSANVYGQPVKKKKRRSNSSTSDRAVIAEGLSNGVAGDVGSGRDFEGIGGWRPVGLPEDDALWTSLNSRLELPTTYVRKHHRSLTSGSLPRRSERRSPGIMTTSPNTSRARSPVQVRQNSPEEYFSGYQAVSRIQGVDAVGPLVKTPSSSTMSSGSSKGSQIMMKLSNQA